MKKQLKAVVVVTGAIVFSTLAINASDMLQGLDGSLLGLAGKSVGPCGEGETVLQFSGYSVCVDVFEASPGDACPVLYPENELQTQQNLNDDHCVSVSKPEAVPWRYVTFTQAQQLCARAGKRLLTNEEWFRVASGITGIDQCVLDRQQDGVAQTGTADCVAPSGVHDIVGNVWEWVDGEVVDGRYNGRTLPDSGYVSLVDGNGVVVETHTAPSSAYGEDFAWIKPDGVRGMIRGGFYGSGADGGLFALNASVPLDFNTVGVGFRCIRDI